MQKILDEDIASKNDLDEHKRAIDGLHNKLIQLSVLQTELSYQSLPHTVDENITIKQDAPTGWT